MLRFSPADRAELIAGLFEVLELEDRTGQTPGPWTLVLGDTETRLASLGDLNRRLSDRGRLDWTSWSRALSATRTGQSGTSNTGTCPRFGFICYVEIPPRGRKPASPGTHTPAATGKTGRTQ